MPIYNIRNLETKEVSAMELTWEQLQQLLYVPKGKFERVDDTCKTKYSTTNIESTHVQASNYSRRCRDFDKFQEQVIAPKAKQTGYDMNNIRFNKVVKPRHDQS